MNSSSRINGRSNTDSFGINVKSNTFVFLDLETTGLPFRELSRTQITEICLISISRDYLTKVHLNNELPRNLNKLTFVNNPGKPITKDITRLTGLDNAMLEDAGNFDENKAELIKNFLRMCKPPICLIAHNGNNFDFPLLKEEMMRFVDIIPEGTRCGDTRIAFQKLSFLPDVTADGTFNPFLTGVDYALADASQEEEEKLENHTTQIIDIHNFQRIRAINETTPQSQKISCAGTSTSHPFVKRKLNFPDGNSCNNGDTSKVVSNNQSFSLANCYLRMFGSYPEKAHRAEDDVITMIQCSLKFGQPILDWLDQNSTLYSEVRPTYSRF